MYTHTNRQWMIRYAPLAAWNRTHNSFREPSTVNECGHCKRTNTKHGSGGISQCFILVLLSCSVGVSEPVSRTKKNNTTSSSLTDTWHGTNKLVHLLVGSTFKQFPAFHKQIGFLRKLSTQAWYCDDVCVFLWVLLREKGPTEFFCLLRSADF